MNPIVIKLSLVLLFVAIKVLMDTLRDLIRELKTDIYANAFFIIVVLVLSQRETSEDILIIDIYVRSEKINNCFQLYPLCLY
jgi:hypothetical protein